MDGERLTVSVITRLSRNDVFLRRVLTGLLKQRGADIEWVIVIQAALTSKHKACLQQARMHNINVRIVEAPQKASLGKLANIGVRASRGGLVLLHDDDDVLRADFIGLAQKKINTESIVAVACHTAVIEEASNGERLSHVLMPGRNYVDAQKLFLNNLITTNGLIYKRSVFDMVGGYREDVEVAEDWLFNLDMLRVGRISITSHVAAIAYRRPPFERSHVDANTNPQAHLLMMEEIRRSLNPLGIEKTGKISKMYSRLKNVIDRSTYKLGGWFFPR